ncbi:hypothetical protein IRJ41_011004 [Triplophysa rosa]|uniref:Uncharacterized protein n=1 Tax=Triplophysa rosa TaxID=992332 RepID=A0A9W7TA70_TRIRA|nr:hypothetical protein IRJ41_011004 [Triplophysa rosa]
MVEVRLLSACSSPNRNLEALTSWMELMPCFSPSHYTHSSMYVFVQPCACLCRKRDVHKRVTGSSSRRNEAIISASHFQTDASRETNHSTADVSDITNHTVADVSHRAIRIQAITSQHKHLIQAGVSCRVRGDAGQMFRTRVRSIRLRPRSKGKA